MALAETSSRREVLVLHCPSWELPDLVEKRSLCRWGTEHGGRGSGAEWYGTVKVVWRGRQSLHGSGSDAVVEWTRWTREVLDEFDPINTAGCP